MLIYYVINVVNLLHVSVTFCVHFREAFLRRMYYKHRPMCK